MMRFITIYEVKKLTACLRCNYTQKIKLRKNTNWQEYRIYGKNAVLATQIA